MSPERWQQVSRMYPAVLEQQPTAGPRDAEFGFTPPTCMAGHRLDK